MTARSPTVRSMPAFQISPRLRLVPGRLFKVVRGSGPTAGGNSIGASGVFLARRIYTIGGGTYVEAIGERTGRRHDLFVAGEPYTSPAGTRERPYRVKLLKHNPDRIRRLLLQATRSLQCRKPR